MARKFAIILSAVAVVFLFFSPVTFAGSTNAGSTNSVDWGKAEGGASEETFKQAAQKLGGTIVDVVRGIAIVVAVVMAVLLALKLFSGGVQAAAEAKMNIFFLILALFVAFNAETIVGIIVKAVKVG